MTPCSTSCAASLTEYYFTPRLSDADAMLRAVGYFTWRHGRIHRIDSLNETWLEVEAWLREDFHVPGLRPAEVRRLRSSWACTISSSGRHRAPGRASRPRTRPA